MPRVNQKADAVRDAETGHLRLVKGARNMLAVKTFYLLQLIPGGIPIGLSGRIRDADRQTSFRGTSENQDHLRNRCLKSWA